MPWHSCLYSIAHSAMSGPIFGKAHHLAKGLDVWEPTNKLVDDGLFVFSIHPYSYYYYCYILFIIVIVICQYWYIITIIVIIIVIATTLQYQYQYLIHVLILFGTIIEPTAPLVIFFPGWLSHQAMDVCFSCPMARCSCRTSGGTGTSSWTKPRCSGWSINENRWKTAAVFQVTLEDPKFFF